MIRIVLFIILIKASFAFEVNTHQALTRCAINTACKNGYSENLQKFTEHSEISGLKNYGSLKYNAYGMTYKKLAQNGEGFKPWSILINPNYEGMIEAGSVLEDAVYPTAKFAGNGRFNNHFYAAQFNSKRWCPLTSYMKTSHTLCYGYGVRTDNIDWVFNKNVVLGNARVNDYGLEDAFDAFWYSFQGTQAQRTKQQAKLFVSLGHIVHMLQDLHSPAHCRDNSHVKGDYLEIYGRYNGGFNLYNGNFNTYNNSRIMQAIGNRGSANAILSANRYYTYEDFFKKEAIWVSNNFASESHLGFEDIDKQTGDGLIAGNGLDSTSLFDGDNPHPSKGETFEGASISGFRNWAYIYTNGNTVSNVVAGTIPSAYRKIGLVKHGLLFDSYHMIAPKYGWLGDSLKQTGLNQKPLEETAINVMPRAVASTQAFIDFFFRGQLNISIDKNAKFTIKNISNAALVSDSRLLTFKQGGKFYIYRRIGSSNELFSTWNLSHDLPANGVTALDLDKKVFKNIRQGTPITIIYKGDIGSNLGGYNSYGVGTRGLSVDVVNLPYIEQDTPKEPDICTSEEEAVMDDIRWLQKYINSDVHIRFPDLDTTDRDKKRVYVFTNTRRTAPDNWDVSTKVAYSNWDYRRYVDDAIDYFNDYIYHLDINPAENADKYTYRVNAKAGTLPVYAGGAAYISYNIQEYKNNIYRRSFTLNNFLYLMRFNNSRHYNNDPNIVLDHETHYDIWCQGNDDICRYLETYVGEDGHTSYNAPHIDWSIWNYGLYTGHMSAFLSNIRRYIGYYYYYKNNPQPLYRYPPDWGRRFVSWIRNVGTCHTLNRSLSYKIERINSTRLKNGLTLNRGKNKKDDVNMTHMIATEDSKKIDLELIEKESEPKDNLDNDGLSEEEQAEMQRIQEEEMAQ